MDAGWELIGNGDAGVSVNLRDGTPIGGILREPNGTYTASDVLGTVVGNFPNMADALNALQDQVGTWASDDSMPGSEGLLASGERTPLALLAAMERCFETAWSSVNAMGTAWTAACWAYLPDPMRDVVKDELRLFVAAYGRVSTLRGADLEKLVEDHVGAVADYSQFIDAVQLTAPDRLPACFAAERVTHVAATEERHIRSGVRWVVGQVAA